MSNNSRSKRLHLLGVPHTVVNEDYLVCAFTGKLLIFPDIIQPFGWSVIEYSNQGSVSRADQHVVVLSEDTFRTLSKRRTREDTHDLDVNNPELQQEFQRVLVEKIRTRARPGDIVCHVWGPNLEVYNLLPECHHIELSVGYLRSPGLPFRVFESSAWMHWHYGRAGQEDGSNYNWVVPSAFDEEKWAFNETPGDYALFLGRITPRKGMNELVDIATRMPELTIHAHGPGDPSPWASRAPSNLAFKGPLFGNERVAVVQQARCMLMPTVFIEPFGFSGIEAQLCGVPLIASSHGAFQETVVEGITGYRCHTLADWVEAIRASQSLDRRQIAALARKKYSREVVGQQYDRVLLQLSDLSGAGWYGDVSRKFEKPAVIEEAVNRRKPRIWIYLPYFGAFPNYFQLYLDSLARNSDCLSVFLVTDHDLSSFRLPDNLIPIPMTLDELRKRAARLLFVEFGVDVQPDSLIAEPYKLCDYKITYLELFRDISDEHGVTEDDFVGWGDCDLIYGKFSDFLDTEENYQIIGGYHGHLTALRNISSFRKLFREVPGLPGLLVDKKNHIIDEISFREPLLNFLEKNQFKMFYINNYFCDVVPECFFSLFRPDHVARKQNFFEVYRPEKEIDHIHYGPDGRLTVVYEGGETRPSIYCHLQKRPMSIDFGQHEGSYYIGKSSFSLSRPVDALLNIDAVQI
jgi:glycosyltransferase involved in cell wall biosynthesis